MWGDLVAKRENKPPRVRFGSWNVGMLTVNSIELVKILQEHTIN